MPVDNRKSKEEIERELAELENLDESTVQDEEDVEEDETPQTPDESNDDEEQEDETDAPDDTDDKNTETPDKVDKTKFDDSVRGAQLEAEKNKQYQEALKKASEIKEVTEDEVIEYAKTQGLEWDDMTTTERILAKRSLINEKRFSTIDQTVTANEEVDKYREKVDEFVDSQETIKAFPRLEGKEADFKKFAMKPTRRVMDLEDVAALFLAVNPDPVKKKGSLFLQGGGGEKVKKAEMTADDASRLRRTNPKEWQRLVRMKKIDPLKDL